MDEEEEGRDSTRLAKEVPKPPFAQTRVAGLVLGLVSHPADSPLPPSDSATARARRRRLLRVSKLKWTRLSLAAAAAESLLLSFHLAEAPGEGGSGGGWGCCFFWMSQLHGDKRLVSVKKERHRSGA